MAVSEKTTRKKSKASSVRPEKAGEYGGPVALFWQAGGRWSWRRRDQGFSLSAAIA